jgi:hypothetical protein
MGIDCGRARKPYDAVWRVTDSPTIEEMLRLWAELDGPRQVKALYHALARFKQSSYGQPWHGKRGLQPTVSDRGVREALTRLSNRARTNPVFASGDPRAAAIQKAILDVIKDLTVWAHDPEKDRERS